MSKQTVGFKGHDNWITNIAIGDINTNLARASTMGQVDKLTSPASRMMTGKKLDLGTDNFVERKRDPGFIDSMTSDLRKMFHMNNKKK
jgi:hypothetical protein